MSPLNRGPLLRARIPPGGAVMRPPMPRYGRAPPGGPLPPPPGPMGRPGPPLPPPLVDQMYGPRRRPGPPGPPGLGLHMARPGPPGPPCPPMFPHRGRPMPPMPLMPHMAGSMCPPRGVMMRPGPRGMLPPHALPGHMRPRFPPHNGNNKGKVSTVKKATKLEEIELKKPWMTDEIRTEIQKKNRLYAKAKKNKDAKEWEEFKDLRNKVTRMIRDAKNEYLAKNPDQAHLYENDEELVEFNDEDFDELLLDSDDETNNLYCEMCDREFISEEKLEQHIQEHEVCNVDGCTFTAHPKIVEKHISMQHYTGLYQRMKNCMNEEDIEKWIAERKRRYPTAANISRQEAAQQEKVERGEVIESQSKKTQNIPRKQEFVKRNRKRKHNNKQAKTHLPKTLLIETYRGLLPFGGTASVDREESCTEPVVEISKIVTGITDDNSDTHVDDKECPVEQLDFNVSDDEEVPTAQEVPPIETKDISIANPGLSLVADYGSDSDEPPDELPCKVSRPSAEEAIEVETTKQESNVLMKNENSKSEKKRPFNKSKTRSRFKNGKKSHPSEKTQDKNTRPSNPVNPKISNKRLRLLNKLLARSIQHERNAIFQCIKFIANNNFFDQAHSEVQE
ncbi:hypothetical protein QAD02_018573 [Eretmocerus hayati]|uniref:Uncharacterized protein n=1 Tax=Eretmocerus hayati TaxID=131215 RepID=A0ACC2PIX6_9HYME|nr:hypothetical protein QAD02_018573 [Eretmocerus hayati]